MYVFDGNWCFCACGIRGEMIIPEKQKHTLYQGATWEWTYRVINDAKQIVNITGCTARMMLRENVDDTTPVVDVTGVVNGPAGEVTFTIPASAALVATWSVASFDAELYFDPSPRIEKLAIGSFKLVRETTRP